MNDFLNSAENMAEILKKENDIRVISHYDCDGICSGYIAVKGFERIGIDAKISFVKEINEDIIKEICKFDERSLFFTDIGSGQLSLLEKLKDDFKIFISDHHVPEKSSDLMQLNPHLFGINGDKEISGAGVTFLLMQFLSNMNYDLAVYSLIGANGDMQINEKFSGFNEMFLKICLENNLIEVKKGLKLFGRNARPLHLALAYVNDPYLPGISNNESGSVQFLSELGIELRKNGRWKTLRDLTFEEEKKIVNALLTQGYDAENLIGNIYLLKNGWELNEFSSLLNACGRLDKPEIGLKICNENNFELSLEIQREYGRRIAEYLDLINNKEIEIIENGGILILNAGDKIHENMIGTITSILSKNKRLYFALGMAYSSDGYIKFSARSSEKAVKEGFRANEIVKKLAILCNGYGGGHAMAAGGKISRDMEERFIKLLHEIFEVSGEYGENKEGVV